MAQRLVAITNQMTIPAGQQVTFTHNLRDAMDRPVKPQIILPDRLTPVRVLSATTTQITVENSDGADQDVKWYLEVLHTILGSIGEFYWQGPANIQPA